ncbi:MAG: hypothetical protein AAGM22_07060 [Acidobacteriota bacterium]
MLKPSSKAAPSSHPHQPGSKGRRRSNLRQLERYVEACRGFLADLDDVLSDLRFQRDGGRLVLATDFSEIYSFALPGDGARDMVHFDPDRDAEAGLAIEASALDTIFFGRFGDILLLKPYHIELHNFMHRLGESQLERTAGHLLELLSEVSELLEQDETRSIIALHGKIQRGEPLSESDVSRAIKFFDHHAPALVLFATRGPGEPGARLRRLLEHGCLTRPESSPLFADEPPGHDEDEARALFEHLEKKRRRPTSGANYLDAVALAQVAAFNRELNPRGTRLVLISRSQTLASTLEAIGIEPVPLRHPRTWSAFFRPLHGDAAAAVSEVEERRNALALFVASATLHLQRAAERRADGTGQEDSSVTERLIQRIEALVEEWLLGQRVLMSGHLGAGAETGAAGSGEASAVARLLELVADDSRIFDEVRSRLEHLSRDHQYLGWVLQSGSARSREIIDTRLVLEGFPEKTVFSPTTADSIQYTIQFSSPNLRKALRGDRWLVRFEQLRSVFLEGLDEDDAYERLLAMAYTLGLLGRWQLAENYAKAALDEAAAEGHTSPHEGHFLLAVCARKSRRSRQRIDAGVARLAIALDEKRRHLGDPSYEDPRYLKEEATLLQVERSLLRFRRHDESADEQAKAVGRIESLLLRAAEKARDDRYLLAQCYNGLCYLYLTEGERYVEAMREYRSRLETTLRDLLHDATAWPANCIDTLCWSAFCDRGEGASADELERWARQLETLTQRPLLAREDRERVERHAHRIRRSLDQRR